MSTHGHASVRWLAAAALAIASAGCFADTPYRCSNDDQCVVDGIEGTCEADDFCAFPDRDCPSGKRYSPFAGGGRARDCVEAEGGTGSETGSDTSHGSSSAASSATGECAEACGGELLWSRRDVELGAARGHGVAVVDATLVVTGAVESAADGPRLFAAAFPTSGPAPHSFATVLDDPDVAGSIGWSIGAAADGSFVVAGSEASDDTGSRALLVRFTANGEVEWQRRYDTLTDDEYRAIGLTTDGTAIAAGRSGLAALVRSYDAAGDELWTRVVAAPATAASATISAIAVGDGGLSWIAGAAGAEGGTSDVWARRLNADGGAAFEVVIPDPSSEPDTASAVVGLADGGFLLGGVVSRAAWLRRVAADGSLEEGGTVRDGAEIRALAIAPDGALVAAGYVDDGDRDLWVASFTSTLETRWESLPFDDAGLDDEGFGVAVAADGTVFVVGFTTDADGEALWLGALSP